MEKTIFHIDVNSAYLSWSALECLAKGETTDLRDIPSIIGGDMEKRHGVVLAKSIPAKAFGVKTGEPIVNAMRKCPRLLLHPPDHTLYHRRSRELMEFLSHISPDIEQVSVDECYMDYTSVAEKYGDPYSAATQMKDSIYKKFGYTVNIGISNRKVLAKMASDFKKPNLVHTLYLNEIQEKMWPLPVSSLYMCGQSSVEVLRKLEILTIGDLAAADKAVLASHQLAGMISTEIKYNTFRKVSHQITLPSPVHSTDVIYAKACALFDELWDGTPVRLLGIRTSKLSAEDEPIQLSIFDMEQIQAPGCQAAEKTFSAAKQQRLDQALDSIRKKYGAVSVIRGSLLHKKR